MCEAREPLARYGTPGRTAPLAALSIQARPILHTSLRAAEDIFASDALVGKTPDVVAVHDQRSRLPVDRDDPSRRKLLADSIRDDVAESEVIPPHRFDDDAIAFGEKRPHGLAMEIHRTHHRTPLEPDLLNGDLDPLGPIHR